MIIHFSIQRFLVLFLTIHVVYGYKTIVDVLSEDARFSTLIVYLQRTRLIPTINNLEAGTFFAPDNEAFERYQGNTITREMLLYHLLPNQYQTNDFEDGQVLETSYVRPGFLGSQETGQMLKITEKLKTLYYVNHARITDRDIFVNKNTTLNVINRVLEPPKILTKVVEEQDEKLFNLMEKTGVDNLLSLEKPFTTFVSAAYLLDKFKRVEQNYLISKYGADDLIKMIKYLIIPEAIVFDGHSEGQTTYTSESGEQLMIQIDKSGKITVNGHRVVEKDILAANGVVHILQDLPVSDSIVFDTRKYLYGLNATKFVSLMESYGLSDYLNSKSSNVTILAPTNEVIDEDDIPNNLKSQWLRYHIVKGAWAPSDLHNHMLLKTNYLSPLLDNEPQRLVVSINSNKDVPLLSSIRFGGHSKVIGSEIYVNDNVIYRLSDPLSLPSDIFTSLIIDLDLSTFIATLYASGAIDEIQKAKSVSLFVPTNQAFKNLGLVSRYLIHPSGREDLQTILKYHVVTSPLYYEDLVDDVLQVNTLANESLIINGKSNKIWISRNQNDDNEDERGIVQESDVIVANGVVHKVDHLQIPENVNITHRNLLRGIGANTMLNILKETKILDEINDMDCIILSPTDKAFEHVDMESLYNDTEKLTRLAKLHVIPKSQSRRKWYPFFGEHEYATLLSSSDKLVLLDVGFGSTVIRVKGAPYSTHARVLDLGRVSTGDRSGGVMEIDSVLFPVERGIFGLPWLWSFALMSVLSLVGIATVSSIGYIGIKRWLRKRAGYVTIPEGGINHDQQQNE